MRYAIFSDIHSNLEAFDAVINAYKKESIDRYIHVGDVVGYAANPKECIEQLKKITDIAVAGNHDWAAVNLFSLEHFNPEAGEAILWTRKNLDESSRGFLEELKLVYKNEDLTAVHGTLHHPRDFNYLNDAYIAEETFRILETTVCFVGHTHSPGIFSKDKTENIYHRKSNKIILEESTKYIIDVGSVGQPRDENPQAAYCIYDTVKKEIEIKRVAYNLKAAKDKIIKAGLPKFLGERLAVGK